MSKRSYDDFNLDEASVSQLLEHANDLLRAVKALKQELKACRDAPKQIDEALSVVARHKEKILPAVQFLGQTEANTADQHESGPRKIQKLDSAGESPRDASAALRVPQPVSLTPWTPQDIPGSTLPALPPALDPDLEQAALTHPGLTTHKASMNYDRLEWLGDAYIYLVATALIYQTFPDLPAGRSTQLRERLVKNDTLGRYALQYGIPERSRLPLDVDPQARNKAKLKVYGDIFESYVAAVILGDPEGLSRVTQWLKSIWSTALADEIRRETNARPRLSPPAPGGSDDGRQGVGANPKLNPKVQLVQLIGAKHVQLSYREIAQSKEKHSGLPWYTIGAYYDGFGEKDLQLGIGSALSKREAGAAAAVKAMENKKLVKRLQALREEAAKAKKAGEQPYDNWS